MKLTQDGEVLAENKVLILYILNKMENPITNDGLLRLVLAVMDMNYFYFQQFLLDLIERNYIVCFNKDGKNVYQITDLGKATLDLTNDMIPGIIKLKVDTSKFTDKDSTKQIREEVKKSLRKYRFFHNRLFKAFPDIPEYNYNISKIREYINSKSKNNKK